MASHRYRKSGFDDLMAMPAWVTLLLAGIVFVGLKYIIPALEFTNPFLQGMAIHTAPSLAGPLAILLLLASAASAFVRWRKRKLLDAQTGLQSIQDQHWRDFEYLVAEVFRRQGYQVEETGGGGPDGGIDIVLRRDGEKTLVQCKRRRNSKVGVREMREFYGVMVSEHADAGILATAGTYTPDAQAFAQGKPLRLIAGEELARLIQSVQSTSQPESSQPAQDTAIVTDPNQTDTPAVPSCPSCDSPMVLRTARKGANTGNQFWGCSRFPACRGVRPA